MYSGPVNGEECDNNTVRRTLEQMGVSFVCERCTNHSPQISEAKLSAESRPNFDAKPLEATSIAVALPPAQVPCSLSRPQGSESRTHVPYSETKTRET
jgi:hypothetical protein